MSYVIILTVEIKLFSDLYLAKFQNTSVKSFFLWINSFSSIFVDVYIFGCIPFGTVYKLFE